MNLEESVMIDLSFNISEKIQPEEKNNRGTVAMEA
jgi:hypothetical protein